MLKKTALALAAATLLLAGCSDNNKIADDVQFYVTDGAAIYTLNSGDALNVDKKDLTGLKSGTLLYAIDVNPRGGQLNGIGSDGQSYIVDASTGTLMAKGTPDTTNNLANKAVEIDYNPTAMSNGSTVYRVTASTGENYRVRDGDSTKAPGTGTTTTGSAGVANNDLLFQYKNGDVNVGKSVVISGIAYTNSQLNSASPGSTTVYGIDSQNNTLVILGGKPGDGAACPNATNPNCGQLTTVGSLGIDATAFVGFDIASVGTSGMKATSDKAYVTAFKDGTYNLYSVNLDTGALTFVTAVNPKIVPVRSFAVKQ